MTELSKLTLPMPRLGETMEEGTIGQWLVQPGQEFKRGDSLLEVETDKTLVEYPALGDGKMLEALAAPGDVIAVGAPIAMIETGDNWDGIERAKASEPVDNDTPSMGTLNHEPIPQSPDTRRRRATPLARRIARQSNISIDDVVGTGRRGRVEAKDVQALVSTARAHRSVVRPAPAPSATIYCVHGFAGLGSNWAALRASLQRVGVTSTAPDLPAHGHNRENAADVETLVDWLVKDLSGQTDPVHIVAHSLGAYVASRAATHMPTPISGLTLIAPVGCGLDINGAFLSGMAEAPGVGELSHLMRLLGPKAAQLDDKALLSMAQGLQGKRTNALARSVARGDLQRIDTIGPLRKLAGRFPIQAVFGLADQIIPREHVFNLPSSVACHMVEAGHMPHWDATDEVASIIATLR